MDADRRIFAILERKWRKIREEQRFPFDDRGGFVSLNIAREMWDELLGSVGISASRERSGVPDPSSDINEWEPRWLHVPEDLGLKILALGDVPWQDVSKDSEPTGMDSMTCPSPLNEKIYDALEAKLQAITERVACGGVPRHSVARAAAEEWRAYLEGLGAKRIGLLMGLCCGAEAGKIRVDDPMMEFDTRGKVEMSQEVADKIATIGLP